MYPLFQITEGVGDSAEGIDETFGNGALTVEDAAKIRGHLTGGEHKLLKAIGGETAVGADEIHNAILHTRKINVGLRCAQNHAAYADGVQGHGGTGNYKRAICGDSERYAD